MQRFFIEKNKVSMLDSVNYHDPIIGIDNEILDRLVMQEFERISEITGFPEYGVISGMYSVDRDACKQLIREAGHLRWVIQKHSTSIDISNARKTFEQYLVTTYNSLPEIDLNNLPSWQLLQRPEHQLKFVLGCILDFFYKNTAIDGRYKIVLKRFNSIERIPKILSNLQNIFLDPAKYIAKYHAKKRFDEFHSLILPFKSTLRDHTPPTLDAAAFNLLLQEYNDIHTLNLSIGSMNAGFKLLLDALKENNTVTVLILSENNLTEQAIKLLGEWLKNNKTIEVLDISGNPFGDSGLEYLLEGLIQNTTLTTLDISSCNITTTGIQKFAEFLKTNIALLHVKINTSFREVELSALLDAVSINRSLINLQLIHPINFYKYSPKDIKCKELDRKIALSIEQNLQNYKLELEKSKKSSLAMH